MWKSQCVPDATGKERDAWLRGLSAGVGGAGHGKLTYFRGLLYSNGEVVWQCDHMHTRPEYNARAQNPYDTGDIWRYSALNCAKTAIEQVKTAIFFADTTGKPFNYGGVQGIISDYDAITADSRCDNVRYASAGGLLYRGEIVLTPVVKELHVRGPVDYLGSARTNPIIEGYVDLIDPSNESGNPRHQPMYDHVPEEFMVQWAAATKALLKYVWGDVFRNAHLTLYVPAPDVTQPPSIEVPVAESLTKVVEQEPDSGFYIKTVRSRFGGRSFEVVDAKTKEVVGTHAHRGNAVAHLERLSK